MKIKIFGTCTSSISILTFCKTRRSSLNSREECAGYMMGPLPGIYIVIQFSNKGAKLLEEKLILYGSL
jgi:hypothetical protein